MTFGNVTPFQIVILWSDTGRVHDLLFNSEGNFLPGIGFINEPACNFCKVCFSTVENRDAFYELAKEQGLTLTRPPSTIRP